MYIKQCLEEPFPVKHSGNGEKGQQLCLSEYWWTPAPNLHTVGTQQTLLKWKLEINSFVWFSLLPEFFLHMKPYYHHNGTETGSYFHSRKVHLHTLRQKSCWVLDTVWNSLNNCSIPHFILWRSAQSYIAFLMRRTYKNNCLLLLFNMWGTAVAIFHFNLSNVFLRWE